MLRNNKVRTAGDPSLPMIYIGQAEHLMKRLYDHKIHPQNHNSVFAAAIALNHMKGENCDDNWTIAIIRVCTKSE